MSIESIRAEFEAWITAPPLERSIDRHGQDAAFPGTYRDLYVDVAWCAWCESRQEVVGLLEANAELHGDYLAAEKKCEELQARVAELDGRDINAIANRVCGDIPEGFEMQLCMENGYGGIELFHKGERVEIDMADWKIHEQVGVAFQCIAQIIEERDHEN